MGPESAEGDLGLRASLLGTWGRTQTLGMHVFPGALPSFWRKPFQPSGLWWGRGSVALGALLGVLELVHLGALGPMVEVVGAVRTRPAS